MEQPLSELAKALAAAQAEFKPIKKTATNPHFKSKYAPLENVIDATQPALKKHGLAITQLPQADILQTVMLHTSGERIESNTPILNERGNCHGYGAGLTYARRYAWSAICGVASEDDTDGNEAVGKNPAVKPGQTPAKNNLRNQYIDLVNRADTTEKWQKIGKWLIEKKAPAKAMKQYNLDFESWENMQNQGPEEPEFLKGIELPEGGK